MFELVYKLEGREGYKKLKTCLAMEKGLAVPNIKTWGVEGGMLFRQKETYNIFSLITFLQKKKLKICQEGPLSYPI